MVEDEVHIPAETELERIPQLVDEVCARAGLRMALRGTLARYPGCVHWHFKRGQERGTLEITWWPAQRRLWLTVRENRTGEWTTAALSQIKDELERRMTK